MISCYQLFTELHSVHVPLLLLEYIMGLEIICLSDYDFSVIKCFCDIHNEFYTYITKHNIKLRFLVNEENWYGHIDNKSLVIFVHISYAHSLSGLLIINYRNLIIV